MDIERETRGNDSWRANAQEESKKLEDSDRLIKVTCLSASMYHFFFDEHPCITSVLSL